MKKTQSIMLCIMLFSVIFASIAQSAPEETKNAVCNENDKKPKEVDTETLAVKSVVDSIYEDLQNKVANIKSRARVLWNKKWFKYGVAPVFVVATAYGIGCYFDIFPNILAFLAFNKSLKTDTDVGGVAEEKRASVDSEDIGEAEFKVATENNNLIEPESEPAIEKDTSSGLTSTSENATSGAQSTSMQGTEVEEKLAFVESENIGEIEFKAVTEADNLTKLESEPAIEKDASSDLTSADENTTSGAQSTPMQGTTVAEEKPASVDSKDIGEIKEAATFDSTTSKDTIGTGQLIFAKTKETKEKTISMNNKVLDRFTNFFKDKESTTTSKDLLVDIELSNQFFL